MKWKQKSIRELAEMVCGNHEYFHYRSSSFITEFFRDCGLDYVHDGTTRAWWVAARLEEVLELPASPFMIPDSLVRILQSVLDRSEAQPTDPDRSRAMSALNVVLNREGWAVFWDDQNVVQIKHLDSSTISNPINPHRSLSPAEVARMQLLSNFLDGCSEDELIEQVLIRLFRRLGFQRVTPTGHEDKALEYGKDLWMKYILPTTHHLYFGIQVKKGKLDAAGATKRSNSNVAEVLNQALMMLGHEIFDPEVNRRVLVDHVYIVAGSEITKQARNWLGERLDAAKRSQVMFMDRSDILNLFIVTQLELPEGTAQNPSIATEEFPF